MKNLILYSNNMSSKSKKEIIENNILLTNYYHINIPYIFDNMSI